jgi:hypothetical protein
MVSLKFDYRLAGSMNLHPRIEVDNRTFYFMLLPTFYFIMIASIASIASIATIGTEKVERCFRLPAHDCFDLRDRIKVYLATTIAGEWFPYDRNDC